jgi:hypothetical protein
MLLAIRYPFILVLSFFSLAGLGALNEAGAPVGALAAAVGAGALAAVVGADALGVASGAGAPVVVDASVDAAFFLGGVASKEEISFLLGAAGA